MAQVLVKNNAYSTLAAGISSSATTITVAVGHGARFPSLSGGDVFYATLINAANTLEIVKVVGRAGDILTVVRGQDGTAGTAYLTGDRIELRPTAALFEDKMSKGGGIFAGLVEVPAGAALAQVPQIQEVVKRAGDTMTGPLTLPTLQGVGGIVNVPTAHRIVSPDAAGFLMPGTVVKIANSSSGALLSSTVAIPWDDTIPQSTEGTQAFSLAFTPLFSTSKLKIDITLVAASTVSVYFTGALFKDADAGALAAASIMGYDSYPTTLSFSHFMNSPGTASVTFKVRFGGHSTNNVALNGFNALRKLGGVAASSLTITEYTT